MIGKMLKLLGTRKVVVVLVFLAMVSYCYLVLDDHKNAQARLSHHKVPRKGAPKINIRLRNQDLPKSNAVKLANQIVLTSGAKKPIKLKPVKLEGDAVDKKDRKVVFDDNADPPVAVLLTADKERLGGLMTTINSIRKNTNHIVHYYILTDAESMDHIKAWIEGTELRKITYQVKKFEGDKIKDKIIVHGSRQELASPLNFARFFISDYFPELTGRVVYLDTDTIVQGDIWSLYSTEIRDGHFGAFSDDCASVSKRFSKRLNYYSSYLDFKNMLIKNLHLDPKACAFDIGVYVIDMQQWKNHKIQAQLSYWMDVNKDQSVFGNGQGVGPAKPPMLIVFNKKFTPLNPMWNVRNLGMTTGKLYSDDFVKSAQLLHWNGVYKPWKRVAQHQNIWDKYYVQDPLEESQVIRKDGNM